MNYQNMIPIIGVGRRFPFRNGKKYVEINNCQYRKWTRTMEANHERARIVGDILHTVLYCTVQYVSKWKFSFDVGYICLLLTPLVCVFCFSFEWNAIKICYINSKNVRWLKINNNKKAKNVLSKRVLLLIKCSRNKINDKVVCIPH